MEATTHTREPTLWHRDKYANEIGETDYNHELVIAGWVHETRNLGGIAFILIRDRTGLLQVTAIKKELGKELFKEFADLPKESVVAVRGMVQPNEKVSNGFEILAKEINVLGKAKTPLPLGVSDEDKAELDTKLDTRLDSRFLDLRKPNIAAIFKLRSSVLKAVRQQFDAEGFIEIHTPKVVATATEGGTALFPVQYFEQKAFLNQSPQLYKQIMMASGLDRVCEVGPAFRAEEHDTVRHLNEFTSIDMEMAFSDEEDAMGVLERIVQRSILELVENNTEELSDMINQLAEAIRVEAQKFDDQTDFLIRNFNVGIDSIKNTFDIKKLDQAIEKINGLSQNILSDIDLDKMREGLKLLAEKAKTN